MQMTSVMNGLVVGKLSGLDTPAALRTGVMGAAVGGNAQMTTVVSVLLARREVARLAQFADGKDDAVEPQKPKVDDAAAKKLDARVAAVEKSAKVSQEGVAELKKSMVSLERTVEKMAKAMEAGTPQSAPASASKKVP